jgi:alpha-L-fucosidase
LTTIHRFACILSTCCLLTLASARAQNFSDVKPSPQQVEWQDLEFGVLIHFGTNTFLDREWGDGKADPKVFNPTQLDAEQWMRALQAAGAKYVILVAKHHDGFCLWPSDQTDYSVKSSPWLDGKGDVVRLVSDAAKKHGLKFGVYLSPWDRHEPRYADSKEYDKYYAAQLDELASSYGNLVEFWLDGAGSGGHVYNFPKIIEELRMYQPNTLVFADTALFEYGDIRWVGNEDGTVPFENWNAVDRHGYLRWRPAEADTPLREKHWFWHPNDEASLKSLDKLIATYDETVGRGAQLILGLAPDNRGLLPEVDVQRLVEFGVAIRRRYSNNLVPKSHIAAPSSSPRNEEAALDGDPDTFWSAPAGSHHSALEVNFTQPVTFDHAILMERLNNGQRVHKFRIEAWDGKQWKPVAQGSAIGHKRIEAFPAITASRVRLNILSSTAEAEICEFQLFALNPPDSF